MLGLVVLGERLNRAQWVAVAFAAAGVAWLTAVAGQPPWIALMVGSSFALYGLIRKTVSIGALAGLAVETVLLTPFAAVYLLWCEWAGIGVLGHSDALVTTLLLVGGVVTSVPLVLFAFGARLVPYSTIGVLQFVAPTMQLACGLVVFHESIGPERSAGFALIWSGLLVYIGNALLQARARRQAMA
jgi:chloramphenicol-sensitive protein RarD